MRTLKPVCVQPGGAQLSVEVRLHTGLLRARQTLTHRNGNLWKGTEDLMRTNVQVFDTFSPKTTEAKQDKQRKKKTNKKTYK